jgi:uncharacterized protein YcfL
MRTRLLLACVSTFTLLGCCSNCHNCNCHTNHAATLAIDVSEPELAVVDELKPVPEVAEELLPVYEVAAEKPKPITGSQDEAV